MANLCDNHLEFTCKVVPSWFKVDPETPHGINIQDESRFLFLTARWYDKHSDIVIEPAENETFHISFGFETKWAPPVSLYTSMVKDDNIVSFTARWYEPGCSVLGYANKEEGIVDEDCPESYYSDFFDLDVLASEPSETYIELNGTDSWITFDDYTKKVKEYKADHPAKEVELKQEFEEMQDNFSS